jgi:glycosyltransferase involved in cell wall biosynthesis
MLKLLDIVPYPYLPYFSGGQKSIAQFLDYLGKETDLTVVGTVNNEAALAKNYTHISLLKKSFYRYFDRSLVSKTVALIQRHKFDAVIWEHPYFSWLIDRVKKKTGIKTIIHTHNIEYQRFKSNGKWWWPFLEVYERKCFQQADIIFCISPEDREFAINQWKIAPQKCFNIPFGITIKNYPEDKAGCKKIVAAKHNIRETEKILLFNGLLDYKPNLDALLFILKEINPLLLSDNSFQYKIIICGKGLPEQLNELKEYADKNIIYAGFVDDIEMYFKASDIFLNPVQAGGGIKTKMVEAIAYGAEVISSETGAAGIEKSVCANKLNIVPDNNPVAFAEAIIKNAGASSVTPQAYYDHYFWGSIVQKVLAAIGGSTSR